VNTNKLTATGLSHFPAAKLLEQSYTNTLARHKAQLHVHPNEASSLMSRNNPKQNKKIDVVKEDDNAKKKTPKITAAPPARLGGAQANMGASYRIRLRELVSQGSYFRSS
jgi:hypothetical protein